MTVAYSRCFDCRSLLSKTINWQFIFRQRRLFHFTSCFLNFIGILGRSFHIIFVCGFLSLRSLNINALSQMEESHSLIFSMRQEAKVHITWKVHIFCSAAHRNVLIACSFSLETIVIRKNFNENDIYIHSHTSLYVPSNEWYV